MDDILISLLNDKNRPIKININNSNELVRVDVRCKNYDLKGLSFYKTDFFPNPVNGDNILIDTISYKYDEFYNPIISFHANIVEDNHSSINISNEFIFDFGRDNIMNTLKNQLNLNKDLKSNLFLYIDSKDKYYYKLKCLEDNEFSFINKKKVLNYRYNFHIKNIIYINDYEEEYTTFKKYIKLTNLSFIETMNE